MAQILIITVGTGTGSSPDRSQRLAQGLLYSVREQRPERVVFLVTEESEQETLPYLKKGLEPGVAYEIRRLRDAGNVEKVYQQTTDCLAELIAQGVPLDEITLDYTSGTKAMSAGAAIAAAMMEVGTLSYINGQREQGIVIPGTEELRKLRPYRIMIDRRLREIRLLFNQYQFQAALALLDRLLDQVFESDLKQRLEGYRKLCRGYLDWDRFNHDSAQETLESLKIPDLDIGSNVGFLKELKSRDKDREMLYIADLLNNAERRAEEADYDDAVARLYRTVELIGQRQLHNHGVIDEEVLNKNRAYKVRLDALGERLAPARLEQLKAQADEHQRLSLGLSDTYRLLADLDDELGRKYEDKELQNLLGKRNQSILAHGLKPISREDYEKLREKVINLASSVIRELEQIRMRGRFPKFPV
jgi:CRISPR-associated protein (TIGR02710 family)